MRRMVEGLRLEFRVQGEDGVGRKPCLAAYIGEFVLTQWISPRGPLPVAGGEGRVVLSMNLSSAISAVT